MTTITLWSDGFDGPTLSGDIRLTAFDSRTNDFTLTMQKAGLHLDERSQDAFAEMLAAYPEPWVWLKDWSIQSFTIDGQEVCPVWQPNRFGEPADVNAFQHVAVTEDAIIISVHAGGTEEEVYERGKPYLKRTGGMPADGFHLFE